MKLKRCPLVPLEKEGTQKITQEDRQSSLQQSKSPETLRIKSGNELEIMKLGFDLAKRTP